MKGNILSTNERLTLYGMVKYPTYNDRRLSEVLGLKMSTVTSIKNRLKKGGFVRSVRVPSPYKLGWDVIGVALMHNSLEMDFKTKERYIKNALMNVEEIFYFATDPIYTFMLCWGPTYTDVWWSMNIAIKRLIQKGIVLPDMMIKKYFPVSKSKIFNFFNYSYVLEHHFDMESDEVEIDTKFEKCELTSMTRIEKRVLYGLVENPDTPDNTVAKKMGVTRQSVTKIRKRFESRSVIKTIRIPSLKKLGGEIFVIGFIKFEPHSSVERRKTSIQMILKNLPTILMICNDSNALIVGAEKNFRNAQMKMVAGIRHYIKMEHISEYPKVYILSLQEMKEYSTLNFAPMLKKYLSIDMDNW